MKGILRVEFDGAIYHVFSRGAGRAATFRDDRDYFLFLERLSAAVDDGGLVVYAWCLLANHFHLLVSTPGGRLSHWIKNVIGPYARCFNRRHERTGYLWQGRYRAILVENGSYLVDCSRYIHLNPCRSESERGCARPELYRWSSYHAYLGRRNPFGIVDTQPVLSYFDEPDADGGASAYRKYVEEGLRRETIDLYDEGRSRFIFGSSGFAREIGKMVTEKTGIFLPGVHAGAVRVASLANPDLGAIDAFADRELADLPHKRLRMIKMFLMKRMTWQESRAVAAFFGVHRATVNRAVQTIEKESAHDGVLLERLGRLMERIHGEAS